jgi:hypothetical protein
MKILTLAMHGHVKLTSCIMKPLLPPFCAMKPVDKLKSKGQFPIFSANPGIKNRLIGSVWARRHMFC